MNILIIQGHPDPDSYVAALADAYEKGARSTDSVVKRIDVGRLSFDPNLRYGYRKRTELEPDLIQAQELLRWADHIVCCYPVWWGSVPAILKGFFDRVLLPGFAFKKRDNSPWWDKYLTGKSARLICTMDTPPWYYRLLLGRPSTRAMREVTFQFVGVKRVKTTAIGPLRLSTDAFREKWLGKVEELGRKRC